MNKTVYVIDDDQPARESLSLMLTAEGLPSEVFASARAFLDQLRGEHQGCVVTDVRMPGMDGMALVAALSEIGSTMPIIVVTGHADVSLAVRAMKAGVVDFIEKPFASDVMLGSVKKALEAAEVRGDVEARRAMFEHRRATLTDRETQVLDLVVDGLSNKEIAQALGISFRTVEIHRANVMAKMHADSLSALVRMTLTLRAA